MTEDSSDEIDFDEELLRIDKDILSLFLGWSNFRDNLADFLNTTRVLNNMPPAPQNSQFNILDDHYENREHEFRRQLVSLLHNCRIVDYVVGHTGIAHDSTAFQCTQIAQENERLKYLSDGSWIWVNSAYPLTPWCVAPYKKPAGGQVTKDQSPSPL
ncbi:hypothetical protein PHLCEN_2v5201 [Hermanssonia centrifuga]|uniref:DDE Tnp4 domain-containing protein n=1 Tax=Hermanssonia centrifuga TaxID=98765 RepID=A0A2R6P8T8_9APHY|nr:hypothetical protein PHLCEN_2v5201 [Hermanssonia centrifuga]